MNKYGLVSNLDLWVRLLQLIDDSTRTLRWVDVPSHTIVVITRNAQADRLAEQGHLCSLIYHSLSVLERLSFLSRSHALQPRVEPQQYPGVWIFGTWTLPFLSPQRCSPTHVALTF